MKQLTKKQFYIINAFIVLGFMLEHLLANTVLDRIFTLPQEWKQVLIVGAIDWALWVTAIILWWKFIKKHHYLFKSNIYPYIILTVLGAVFLADAIIIGANLSVPFTDCLPTSEMTAGQYSEMLDHFLATGECTGTFVQTYYSFSDNIGFYAILFLIALVSYIRGRRKKRIQDMPKEELFQ